MKTDEIVNCLNDVSMSDLSYYGPTLNVCSHFSLAAWYEHREVPENMCL